MNLKPKPIELSSLLTGLLYVIFAFLTLVIVNARHISDRLFNNSQPLATSTLEDLASQTDRLGDFLSTLPFTSTIASVVIWATIGISLYFVVQSTLNEIKDVSEDIDVAEHDVFTRKKARADFIRRSILRQLYKLVIYATIIIWAYLIVKIFIPFCSALIIISLFDASLSVLTMLISLVGSIAVLALSYFALGFFIKIRKINLR